MKTYNDDGQAKKMTLVPSSVSTHHEAVEVGAVSGDVNAVLHVC